ncbi:MAG: hypothetical protein JWM20_55 [Patescibacteria group bacterium]|nr:hypothetical protein [Patescibacteria group bacterium]
MVHEELTKEDFLVIKQTLEEWGFESYSKYHFQKTFRRLGIIPPRMLVGREEGFIFRGERYNAMVWVSWVESLGRFRTKEDGGDCGWVLIREGDRKKYFSKPIYRVPSSFVEEILSKAWIARYRVLFPPHCKCCDAVMDIHEKYKNGEPTGQMMWACFKEEFHPDQRPRFTGWDKIGPEGTLPKKAQAYVDERRKRVANYKKRNEKLGITPVPRRKTRKKWKVTKPQNLIPQLFTRPQK